METVLEILAKVKPNVDFKNATAIVDDGLLDSMDIVMLVVYFFTADCFVALIVFLFTVLLVPYVFHYYFLENSVQRMYVQYDLLKKKMVD